MKLLNILGVTSVCVVLLLALRRAVVCYFRSFFLLHVQTSRAKGDSVFISLTYCLSPSSWNWIYCPLQLMSHDRNMFVVNPARWWIHFGHVSLIFNHSHHGGFRRFLFFKLISWRWKKSSFVVSLWQYGCALSICRPAYYRAEADVLFL